ncbi:glycosyltransferase [bacterium]|nr:glycosyltransferase [bacterium]
MEKLNTDIAETVRERIPAQRVALVHDWLTGMRGGEMVLEELCRMFPEADLFTLIHIPGRVSKLIENRLISESPIARLPFGRRWFRVYLPLFPMAIESFDLNGYDLVISTSHCVAKGVIPAPNALHVAYIHTPMRYVWDLRSDYIGPKKLKSPARAIAGIAAHYLRSWDVSSSARVDEFVANSNWVSSRIKKYYRRDASVVYPPVSIERFSPGNGGGGYFLIVSALVPYKRVDIAIEAFSRLRKKLVVVGDGPERHRLKHLAGSNVKFTGSVSSEDLVELYRNSEALIYPGIEDFGIVLVEAQACGRPVIAFKGGGALETVISDGDKLTGVFFTEQSSQSLIDTLTDFEPHRYDPAVIRSNAERFKRERFLTEMTDLICKAWHVNSSC